MPGSGPGVKQGTMNKMLNTTGGVKETTFLPSKEQLLVRSEDSTHQGTRDQSNLKSRVLLGVWAGMDFGA